MPEEVMCRKDKTTISAVFAFFLENVLCFVNTTVRGLKKKKKCDTGPNSTSVPS